LLRIFI